MLTRFSFFAFANNLGNVGVMMKLACLSIDMLCVIYGGKQTQSTEEVKLCCNVANEVFVRAKQGNSLLVWEQSHS